MADLGVLRTFVNNFGAALDILDEAARIKATTEERRAELASLTTAWQAQKTSLDAAKAATAEAQSRQVSAEGAFRDSQRVMAEKQANAQQAFERDLAKMEKHFQVQRESYQQELDQLSQLVKAREADARDAQDKVDKTKAALRDLVASVR